MRYSFKTLLSIVENEQSHLLNGTKIKTNFSKGRFNYNCFGHTVNPKYFPGFLADIRGFLPRFKFPRYSKLERMSSDMQLVINDWKRREKKAIAALPPGTRRYLVLSFGTWDLARRKVKYFVKNSIPLLLTFLESVQRDSVLARVKIIVTTVPAVLEGAYKDYSHPGYHSCLRNNALLAAVNALIAAAIKRFLNVYLVDWFEISVSRTNFATDTIHYLKYDKKVKKTLSSLNDIEKIMTMTLADQICSLEKTHVVTYSS